jgi:hypothetical protein
MRVDKDALIKHHFWIGLGLFFILILADIVMIKTSAADVGGKAKADFDSALSGITSTSGKAPKNPSFNEPWIAYGKTFRGQKENVWGDAWNVQKDMFDWPSSAEYPLNRLKYPDDDIKFGERMEYRESLWKTQFPGVQAEVAPIEIRGGTAGYVRIMMPGTSVGSAPTSTPGNSSADPANTPRSGPGVGSFSRGGPSPTQAASAPTAVSNNVWDMFWRKVPTEEECWLAQEDFWVKRELLRIVKDAVVSIARFTEVKIEGDKEPLPRGVAARHLFRNNLWEINFLVEQKGREWFISDRSTIKNLHPDHRTVPLSASPASGGLHFLLTQSNKVRRFRVDGEPLPYGASTSFRKSIPVDTIDFKKPFGLEQEFETANSPVRQIMDLELWKNSHRTSSMPLMTSLLIKPKPDDLGTPPAAGTPPGGAPAGAPVGGKPSAAAPGGAPGAPAAAAGADTGDTTPNGLPRRRYLFRTEQVRHIPIALHLVVDQAHMHEVLVAMSNSRLRVQTTQVQYRHLSGFRPETTTQLPSDQGGGVYAPEEDPNLLEMAIYGIASIYERFPPKNAPPAAAAPAGAPATGTPAPATGAPAAPTAAGAPPAPTGQPGAPPAGKAGDASAAKGPATATSPAGKAGEGAKTVTPAAVPPPGKPADAGKAGEASKSPPGAQPAQPAKPPEPPKPTDKGKAP